MKKIILFVFAATISLATNAQIQTPAPSPFQKTEQKVGLTDVTLEYSRPGMKGRKIFGGLEDFGKVWRTSFFIRKLVLIRFVKFTKILSKNRENSIRLVRILT